MKKLTAIIIGAGGRGMGYSTQMKNTDLFDVVAVAEPIDARRNVVKELHNIPDDKCFTDWKPLLELGKIADIAVICTMDRDHYAPAMKAIEQGYDLLLEKPIAPTPEQCRDITFAAEQKGVKVVICTVLRYTSIFMTLKEAIDSGKLGKIMAINHEEGVGNIHQSHSFVRGNWGNSERSSNMLLQKSCHDIDILQWLLGKKCKSIQSYGMRSYFREENAPADAPLRCIDGCPHGEECPYNAIRLYYDNKNHSWFRNSCAGSANPSDEEIMEALKTNNYGKCVYKLDNDVVDHQTVNMHFEDDVLVTFSMNAFNAGGRFIHIMGTKGEIRAAMDGQTPIEFNAISNIPGEPVQKEVIDLVADNNLNSGHGGGDEGIIRALHSYLCGEYNGKSIPTITESYYNHLITFAAEESRASGKVVDVADYIRTIETK